MSLYVSIIIPVYNVEAYVRGCVESVLAQSYSDIEVILVDDGSTDKSGAICDEFAELDSRVKVVHKENGGLSSARNAGIEVATGDYLAFVDGDDGLVYDAIQCLADIVVEYEHPDLIQFLYEELYEDGCTTISDKYTGNCEVVFDEYEKYRRLYEIGGCAASACTKLYKRTMFESLRFKTGILHEDEYIVTDMLSLSDKCVYLNRTLYCYYVRGNSIITSGFSKAKMDVFYVMNHRVEVLEKKGYDDLVRLQRAKIFTTIYSYYYRARKAGFNDEAKQIKAHLKTLPGAVAENLSCKDKIFYRLCKLSDKFLDIYYYMKTLGDRG